MRIKVARALLAVVLAGGLLAGAGPAHAAPTPPAQPGVGELGGPGPCAKGSTYSGFGSGLQRVWMHTPTGTGSPRTGGTCDDSSRPVVFIATGFGVLSPANYEALIDDMVSNGHIVVVVAYSLLYDPDIVYPQIDNGFRYSTTWLDILAGDRMDLDNIGLWGHSYGAGALPWLAAQADARGWGSESLWLSAHATAWLFRVPATGEIPLPSHARVHVVAYEEDDKSDHGVGIDAFKAFSIPDSQKDHIQVLSDVDFVADHRTPTSRAGWSSTNIPSDHLDWYGVNKSYQALADCARFGLHCDADLTYMGTWSDGQDAAPAIVSDDPDDMGPPAAVECENTDDPAGRHGARFCLD